MERDSLHGVDQTLSLYKYSHLRNHPMVREPYLPKPYYSFPPSTFPSKGLLNAPPLSLLPLSLRPPQPPLLPLPAALPRRSSSCPAPAVKVGTRAPKKSKKSTKPKNKNVANPKKEERETPRRCSETKEVPTNISRDVYNLDEDGGFPVFKISPPPPSSLPLPTFSLRPKLGCNAVAAGVDAGATDDLRRILRLQ